MAAKIDKLPEPKKEPPKPAPKPAETPAVAAPVQAPASNGVAATKAATAATPPAKTKAEPMPKQGSIPRPAEILELQGMSQFQPGSWASYIKSFQGEAADVDVKWGTLAAKATLPVTWDNEKQWYATKAYHAQPIPMAHPFFAGLPANLAPALFVRILKSDISGFAAPAGMRSADAIADVLNDKKNLDALGLVGFRLPKPSFRNEIKDGHFQFGTESLDFKIGWVSGSLKLGLLDAAITFAAAAHIAARALTGDFVVERGKDGHYTGQAEIGVTLGKASGTVLAKYAGGDVTVTGTLKYASEKFDGSLTVMFGDVNEVQQAARGQLDPDKLLADAAVPDEEGPKKGKTGEKGLGAWGTFNFRFTEWMTGSAQGILDPFGHVTIVGEIKPPKEVRLMGENATNVAIPPFPLEVTARYGLPYVADVHLGVVFGLGAVARIGPAVLTDIVVKGTYSTDPKVKQDFSLSGAFRISAYAGLNLSVSAKAGITILKHDIDAIATITGSAGIKAYAEARPTIGYREKDDPVAGKKGEAYLQGHLEAAAQPVLGLGGKFEIKLTSPWWSPAPNKTWTWPLFDLEWPLATSLGIGADIDYVIGSDKLPDVKLGKVDFDASKFIDSAIDKQIPPKSGGADKEKAGTWQGKDPPPLTAPPSAPAKGPEPVGGKPTAGTPSGKVGKGQQTLHEAANVPKTPDAAQRWSAGMQALAKLHEAGEKAPETSTQIHQNLARIKADHGFTKLDAHLRNGYWFIDAAMNSSGNNIQSVKAGDPKTTLQPGEGRVGTYSEIQGPTNDDVTPHHTPAHSYMTTLGVKGYTRGKGIAINMWNPGTKDPQYTHGRHYRTRTFGNKARTHDPDPLAELRKDIEDVRVVFGNDGLLSQVASNIDTLEHENTQAFPSVFTGSFKKP